MTIIWDFSSQEPVCADGEAEAEGILRWGAACSPEVAFPKKMPHPAPLPRLALRSCNYSKMWGQVSDTSSLYESTAAG